MTWVLSLLMGLLATVANAQPVANSAIPAHPRDLQIEERPLRFPTSDEFRHRLPSGLIVIVIPDESLPLVEFNLALDVGGDLDPPGREGTAYLTATLLRRGGSGGLDASALEARLADLAIDLRTVGRVRRSGIRLSVPAWTLEPTLDLFCSLVTRPRFDPDEIARVRGQLHAMMPHRFADPTARALYEWTRLVHGAASPEARDLTPSSLENIDAETLRRFHTQHWRPDRMVLAISGKVRLTPVISALRQNCPVLTDAAHANDTGTPPADNPTTPAAPGLYHVESDSPQSQILLGHRLPPLPWDDPDRAGLRILAEILGGGGSTARLAGRLRAAEGLVYQVTTDLDTASDHPGTFSAFFETTADQTARALSLAIHEIERLRRETVHPSELETARREVLSPLRRTFDSAEGRAGHLAEDELLGRDSAWRQRLPDALGQVDRATVQRLARRFLRPDELIVVVVGPWREIERGARADGIRLKALVGKNITSLPNRNPLDLTAGDSIRRP